MATSAAIALAASIGVVGTAQADSAITPASFTATVAPQLVDAGVSQKSFALTITNCATTVTNCTGPSGQNLGSATIQLPAGFANVSASVSAAGWSIVTPIVGGLVQVDANQNGDDDAPSPNQLTPGQSIVVTIVADTPSTSGYYTFTTAAENDPVGDGPEEDDPADEPFPFAGPQPQVGVGIPDHLVFVGQPSDVQVTSGASTPFICPPPSLEVVTADGSPVTSGSASVSLLADTAFGNPGLGGTTTATTVGALATFGTAACAGGVDASTVGSNFKLKATATWTLGGLTIPLVTAADSSPFSVVQLITTCAAGQTCNGAATDTHTSVKVATTSATTTDQLEIAIGADSFAGTTCHPFFQPNGIEVTRVVANDRGKTVTLTFDKTIVNQKPLYLILLFPICFSAPWGNWVTDLGRAPTFNTTTNEFEGLLPICLPRFLPAGNPCVQSR
ncbi:MAG TPA: hypothetical protein VGD55_05940, partial [Acidothermaceae bacterium]